MHRAMRQLQSTIGLKSIEFQVVWYTINVSLVVSTGVVEEVIYIMQ